MKPLLNKSTFKLLFVEDNTMLQLYFGEILRAKGIAFDLATNGLEAVEKVKNSFYDLIIMDIEMPKMNGFEATKIIRDFNLFVPIVAFTALNENEIKAYLTQGMMNDFYPKWSDAISINRVIEKYNSKIA
jgi:CheY-like chemotaxis protein